MGESEKEKCELSRKMEETRKRKRKKIIKKRECGREKEILSERFTLSRIVV